MPDYSLKSLLENAAEQIALLESSEERQKQLVKLSEMPQPPCSSTVLLMEAVIVLLSPQYSFKEPTKAVASVTWPSARRLLSSPEQMFRKLRACDTSNIPRHNLNILCAYRSHARWPKSGEHLRFGDNGALSRVLSWVNVVVKYALDLIERGGAAKRLTKQSSTGTTNLFGAVVSVKDNVSVKVDLSNLLWAVLRDMKVHTQARILDGEHCVMTIFHASKRLFFFCYTPQNARRTFTKMSTRKLEDLICPNTVERMRDPRPAPNTCEELYLRLMELLCFDTRENISDAELVSCVRSSNSRK